MDLPEVDLVLRLLNFGRECSDLGEAVSPQLRELRFQGRDLLFDLVLLDKQLLELLLDRGLPVLVRLLLVFQGLHPCGLLPQRLSLLRVVPHQHLLHACNFALGLVEFPDPISVAIRHCALTYLVVAVQQLFDLREVSQVDAVQVKVKLYHCPVVHQSLAEGGAALVSEAVVPHGQHLKALVPHEAIRKMPTGCVAQMAAIQVKLAQLTVCAQGSAPSGRRNLVEEVAAEVQDPEGLVYGDNLCKVRESGLSQNGMPQAQVPECDVARQGHDQRVVAVVWISLIAVVHQNLLQLIVHVQCVGNAAVSNGCPTVVGDIEQL
mmetsp:Transcript_577/g.1571  ORF Transcript_577/g.1571 Transcript_577/m.1571 type:complete len:320 (-) Transcript_577:1357-2316(-)